MVSTESGKQPLVWLLTGDKGGDNAQMRSLAKAAGLQPVEIALAFNKLHRRSNLRLGATTGTLTDAARSKLQPPWPDVVLSSGRRSVPVARWIRRQSGGRTKLIHIGRPWGRLAWFDLVLAMPQYALPDAPNVFQARMPFNKPDPEILAAAAEHWRARFEAFPRPWIGLLVGGRSAPYVLDAATAGEIGTKVSVHARQRGGGVLAVTSRRTGTAATEALFAALTVSAFKHGWSSGEAENPYLGILALADEFVVTGDSASMIAEAVRSRRRVTIAPLPVRMGRRRRRVRWMRRILPAALFDWFVDLGLFTSLRDMARLHRRLLDEKLIAVLGEETGPSVQLEEDLPRAAEVVRRLASRART